MDRNSDYHSWAKKVLFIVQLLVLIFMMMTALTNIILKTGNLPLWTALLGSSLGFLLPNPKFRNNKDDYSLNTVQSAD